MDATLYQWTKPPSNDFGIIRDYRIRAFLNGFEKTLGMTFKFCFRFEPRKSEVEVIEKLGEDFRNVGGFIRAAMIRHDANHPLISKSSSQTEQIRETIFHK